MAHKKNFSCFHFIDGGEKRYNPLVMRTHVVLIVACMIKKTSSAVAAGLVTSTRFHKRSVTVRNRPARKGKQVQRNITVHIERIPPSVSRLSLSEDEGQNLRTIPRNRMNKLIRALIILSGLIIFGLEL
jgi:hypothetical protein